MSLECLMGLSERRSREGKWGGDENYSLHEEMRQLNDLLERIKRTYLVADAEFDRYIEETGEAWE